MRFFNANAIVFMTFGSFLREFEWANRSAERQKRVDRVSVKKTRIKHTVILVYVTPA